MVKNLSVNILCIFLLFLNPLAAQELHLNKVDSLLRNLEVNNKAIGSVSIFKSGKEVYNRSFGQKNIDKLKLDKNYIYQVGSITKLVTSVLVFKLIDNNKLSLETKLSSFFPEIPNANVITIKNLLNHTSGLADYVFKDGNEVWLKQKVSHQEILNEIIKQGILFQPNESVKYSNSAYYLLARIVEKLYDMDYNKIIQKEISKPLKLKNFSSYVQKNKNVLKSYFYDEEWKELKDFDFSNVIGVGDISSTMQDLNVFINNLFNGKLITKHSLELMKPYSADSGYYGLGMYKIPFKDCIFIGHGGDTYGTHTLLGYNIEQDLSISLALNGTVISYNDFYIAVVDNLFGKSFDFVFNSFMKVDEKELEIYNGIYSNRELPLDLSIFVENGVLKAQATDQEAFLLDCYEKDKFLNDANGIKIHFEINKNKLTLFQHDEIVEFLK